MSRELKDRIPEAADLLMLEPEELAQVLLPILKSREKTGETLSAHSFTNEFRQVEEVYPRAVCPEIMKAIMESWGWLQTRGILASKPEARGNDHVFLTRAAWQLETVADFENFRKSTLLSPKILHPIVAAKAWPTFIRGRHDTAVFEAFKEVEIAVRTAGNHEARVIGVDLMRAAFHHETGSLTDKSQLVAEREALSALFAGAIGSYKNPVSHRTVVISDASEAGEMLILASHLLRIVDARVAMRKQPIALP